MICKEAVRRGWLVGKAGEMKGDMLTLDHQGAVEVWSVLAGK